MNEPLLWQMIGATRGGPTRLGILLVLSEEPLNANQLSEIMRLDYKTVRHHLDILMKNGLIYTSKQKKYGELYCVHDFVKKKIQELNLGKL